MKLYFRQGIARTQSDAIGSPGIFIQRGRVTAGGQFFDLIVSPDPTLIVFAHRDSNYIVEETRTVTDAWGPFTGSQNRWLYWDINPATGVLTRKFTLVEPSLSSGTAPVNPVVDQHWFDHQTTTMRFWNGSRWIECIRVFAAKLRSGSMIEPYQIGSQVGIAGYDGQYEGGSIVLDVMNVPLLQSNGTFVTTVSPLAMVHTGTRRIKFEAEVATGIASQFLNRYSLVQMRPGRQLVLANSSDPYSRVAGMVVEEISANEVGTVITEGLVRNDSWNFTKAQVGRSVFCSSSGSISTTPPVTGVLQAVGYVYDSQSVYLNILQAIILDDMRVATPISPVTPGAPVVDFIATNAGGPAPHTVKFNSVATNSPLTYEWDFTNNGVIDATGSEVTWTYNTPGTYTVRHVATNVQGTSSILKEQFVVVTTGVEEATTVDLEILLDSAKEVVRRSEAFTARIQRIANISSMTATNVVVQMTVRDVQQQAIKLTNLPIGSSATRAGQATVYTLPPIASIGPGEVIGPISFSVIAPPVDTTASQPFLISAVVFSSETDLTTKDNSSVIDFTVVA